MSSTLAWTSEWLMGTYSDGSRVRIEGVRGGFTYITFIDGRYKGTTTKVPSSWVEVDLA